MTQATSARTVLLTCDFEAAYTKHVGFPGYRMHSAPAMARILTERGLPMSWLIQLEREDLYLNVDYFQDRIAPSLRWGDGHSVELHIHFDFGPQADDTVRGNRLRLLERGVTMLARHGYRAQALRPGPSGLYVEDLGEMADRGIEVLACSHRSVHGLTPPASAPYSPDYMAEGAAGAGLLMIPTSQVQGGHAYFDQGYEAVRAVADAVPRRVPLCLGCHDYADVADTMEHIVDDLLAEGARFVNIRQLADEVRAGDWVSEPTPR